MSHPPPVSPQLFDAALLIALVTLQACLPSPLLSGQMALHFLCVPLCLALCLALELLTNYLSDEWIQIKFRLTINLLQRMESSISGNCIEVIGSEIKLLKCLLDTWVSDFLGTLHNKWHIFDQSQRMWVFPSGIYQDPATCPRLLQSQGRATGKGRHNRRVRLGPVLKHLSPNDAETPLLNLFDTQSWPQNPGWICWCLNMAHPDRLVSVTVSQDHNMSQWAMVTSLKHPDMRSTIMQPNQCLWGDEWFQYNHKFESRKASGELRRTYLLEKRWSCASLFQQSCCLCLMSV